MCDASEAFDEIVTWIGKHCDQHLKKKGGFKNIVGFELYKKYSCECWKVHDFPLDPN